MASSKVLRKVPTDYSICLVFDLKTREKLEGVSVVSFNSEKEETCRQDKNLQEAAFKTDATVDTSLLNLTVSDSKICNCCQVDFADRNEQLDHYKSDWHRYNLHLRLRGLPSVSEDRFETVAGDVSSISGSDEESENENVEKIATVDSMRIHSSNIDAGTAVGVRRLSHKIYMKNKNSELISVYRCLLQHKKEVSTMGTEDLISSASKLPNKQKWAILMISSGHFAGAIFDGKEVVDHKTFHRYTVRAKRGSSQSSHDNKGSHANSAGANLRRYNESALAQEVQDVLVKWKDFLKSRDFIFVRIPVVNRAIFYGGKTPALNKDDPRIRVVPFATRRPTFSETKRVQLMLASLECYGKEVDFEAGFPLSPPRHYLPEEERLEVREPVSRISTKVEKKEKKLKPKPPKQKCQETFQDNSLDCHDNVIGDSEEVVADADLVETMATIDFSGLKEFDQSPRKKRNYKKKSGTSKQEAPSTHSVDFVDLGADGIRCRNTIFTACKTGNIDLLKESLTELRKLCNNSVCDCQRFRTDGSRPDHDRESNLPGSANGTSEISSHENQTSYPSFERDAEISSQSLHSSGLIENNVIRDNHLKDARTVSLSANSSEEIQEESAEMKNDSADNQPRSAITLLNSSLGDSCSTFLHVAAAENQPDVITALLEAGVDPARKDKKGRLPYVLGKTEVRNAFRRFMASNPTKYDYSQAQIPAPLTEEMEAERKQKAAEKRKAKKKAMHERDKEKKAVEAKERAENEEKDRFLALSDREKRALAAERRILKQHESDGASKPVLSRCFQCAADMTGRVPFEYSNFIFCTTKCLREHRSKAKQ